MTMYLMLAIFSGAVGLLVAGAAFYTVWFAMQQARAHKQEERPARSALELASPYLLRWTALDYAGLLLSLMGLIFLLADLIGVIRDRNSYPYYHYGYLASAFFFLLVATLFLLVRLSIVLRLAGASRPAAPEHGGEPEQADQAE